MERRLVTILAADAVGYSRLVADDEDAALTHFQRCGAIMTEIFQAHQGRVFGGAGDSVVCEFSSPVEALRCAVEIQQQLEKANEKLDEEKRMRFRLGLNLGDAVVVDGNLFGEAVNVAARLEGLAEPGGICISGGLYEQVKHLPDFGFRDLGSRNLKNIPFQVQVYAVEGTNERRSVKRVIPRWWPAAAAILVLAAVLGGWKYLSSIPSITASSQPSIAVLPLANLSGDASQEYFSDGLTQDITTDLSKFSNLFVVASNSAFTYKGKAAKAQDIRKDLGVNYMLEGTVLRSNDVIRINAQLVETSTGNHIWAEKYTRSINDTFNVLDEIAQTVVTNMAVRIEQAERERVQHKETTVMSAYEAWLKGRAVLNDPDKYTKVGNEEARGWFNKAKELDPNYARAYGYLSYVDFTDWSNAWSDNPDKSLEIALQEAQKALSLDAQDYQSYWSLGTVLVNKGEFDKGIGAYEKAVEMNPNDATLLAEMGEALVVVGRHADAIKQVKEAITHNPHHEFWYLWTLGWAQYMNKEYADAIKTLTSIATPPNDARLELAASYAQLAKTPGLDPTQAKEFQKKAEEEIAKFQAEDQEPKRTVATVSRWVFKQPGDLEHYLQGLCRAGLPPGDYDCKKLL